MLVVVVYMPYQWTGWLAAGVFSLAAVTDWIDGYLARKWNQTTPFGAFLDPVADKLMVAVALVLLLRQYDQAWFVIAVAIIICREILISALREWMAELGKRTSVAVSVIGKFKTTMQMVAIILLLTQTGGITNLLLQQLGFVSLLIAAVLTIWSMVVYLRAAWPDLTQSI